MTATAGAPKIVAHRGFSSRQPEMTLAAYEDAIDWSVLTGMPLGLECDVRFSRDDELVCVHDPSVTRTSNGDGLVEEQTLAELRNLDFGSWKVLKPTMAQRSVMSLADLLDLVAAARYRGVEVTLSIETKHPNSRGLQLERQVCALLAERGWDRAGAPVRLITFSVAGARLLARLVPELDRTLLVTDSEAQLTGILPSGIRAVGIDISLLRRDPGIVSRARARGNEVHVWTVNDIADLQLCRDAAVSSVTTDYPDRARDVLDQPVRGLRLPSTRRRRSARLAAA